MIADPEFESFLIEMELFHQAEWAIDATTVADREARLKIFVDHVVQNMQLIELWEETSDPREAVCNMLILIAQDDRKPRHVPERWMDAHDTYGKLSEARRKKLPEALDYVTELLRVS